MQMWRSMQHIGWTVLLGLVIAGCSRYDDIQAMAPSSTSSALVAVDSLMWRQPDSALVLLLPWFDSAAAPAEYDRHYAHLLLSELLYKNYCEQTNRAELLQAESYFDSLVGQRPPFKGVPVRAGDSKNASQSLAFLAARAHYMDGVGHYERDSLVPACREYMKALEIMEGRFDEKDLTGHKTLFMAYAFSRLMEMYSDLYLHEQTICFARLSLEYYIKTEAPSWYSARIFNELGMQYEMMTRLDSAQYYYLKAAKVLHDTNSLLYRDIITHLAVLDYKNTKQIDTATRVLYDLLSKAQYFDEYMARAAILGEIFYHEKQYDSALVYLNMVYENSERTDSRKQAAEWIVGIYKAKGYDSKILEYAEFLVPFANQEENQSAIKSQLTELYNAFQQKKMEFRHQALTQRNKKLAIAVVGGLLCVLLVLLIIHMRRKHRFKTQLEAQNYAHEVKQKALAGRLKTSNDALYDTLKRMEEMEVRREITSDESSSNSIHGDYDAFMQTAICQEIMDRVRELHLDKRKALKTNSDITEYKSMSLSEKQTASLTKAVKTYFPNLYRTLKTHYPDLNHIEWLHCCLYLMNVDKMSICVLLQEPYYTCRRYTVKMEEVFDCRRGLSSFLMTLVETC